MSTFITVIRGMNANAITQNTAENFIVDLDRHNASGFFSLQILVTGAGNVTVTWAASLDNTNYITPTGTSAIFTAHGASSGPGSDGKDLAAFDPVLCRKLKIIFTEQNAGAVVVTADIGIQ